MQKKYIPFTILFVVLLVILAGMGARLNMTVPAFTFAEEEKRVYLTFDDGPSTKVTTKILDVLQKEGVKATFFIVGDRTAGREEIVRRTARDGHTLGVHSQTHKYSEIYASNKSLIKDIKTCAQKITQLTGVIPHVYRFPGGIAKDSTKKLVEAEGYRVVGWNAVCGDEEIRGATADTLYEQAVRTSAGKRQVVLLCHDSASHAATAEALPRIIAYYREHGYVFCAF